MIYGLVPAEEPSGNSLARVVLLELEGVDRIVAAAPPQGLKQAAEHVK